MNKGTVIVIGAGGHAKVVLSTLKAAGYSIWGILDDDPTKKGQQILGVEVRGLIAEASLHDCHNGVIAIGDNFTRKQIVKRMPDMNWVRVMHPWAYVADAVEIGAGSVVFAGAVIQPGTVIGRHVIINTGATVDHDCVLGDFVHIAPGCHLAGGVFLDEGCFMGIASAAIPGTHVGAWTTVGAGAIVVDDIPASSVAVGLPAKVK